jgi:GNAT superfamily N-acetyltransferase
VWDERARVGSAGDDGVTFVAVEGEVCVGMAAAFPDAGADRDLVELVGMWTAPEVRRQGVATRLVEAVVGWAADIGAERVELWVTGGNQPAQRLYEHLGFEPTGDHQPLPSDPCKDEVRMRRRLSSS